jgi:hypothetical protein
MSDNDSKTKATARPGNRLVRVDRKLMMKQKNQARTTAPSSHLDFKVMSFLQV